MNQESPKEPVTLMGKTVFYRFFGRIEQGVVWFDDGRKVRVRPLRSARNMYGPWVEYKDLVFL